MDMFGNVPFESLPPELQEAIKRMREEHQRQHDLQNMQIEASRHRMNDFLLSLDEEGVHCLRGLIHMMVADSDNETAGFYLGLTAGILASKFNYCMMCQVKHDSIEEALAAHGQQDAATETDEEKAARLAQRDSGPMNVRQSMFTPADIDDMVTYGIHPDPEGGYKCGNCGYKVVSIEDRKLREPGKGGCPGCKHKEKWG